MNLRLASLSLTGASSVVGLSNRSIYHTEDAICGAQRNIIQSHQESANMCKTTNLCTSQAFLGNTHVYRDKFYIVPILAANNDWGPYTEILLGTTLEILTSNSLYSTVEPLIRDPLR